MFIVVWTNPTTGSRFPLRGTVWAYDMSRAEKFPTREAAQAMLDKAKAFMRASVYRKAVIEEVGA